MPNASWTAGIENKTVEAYLRYLATGELPVASGSESKTEALEQKIVNEDRLFVKVQLLQQLHNMTVPTTTAEDLVEAFVKHASGFSERNGIKYATWREMGVPAAVLTRAGFKGASSGGRKLAPDDPRRTRPYRPRRVWTEEEKAEYIAFYEANNREATAERYGTTPKNAAQRYYGFKAKVHKAAGEPPRKRGRPPKKQAS